MTVTNFTYDNRALEVKAERVNGDWFVRVFENGQPANGVLYSVPEETAGDAKAKGLDLIDELMKAAQDDFVRWSDYLENSSLHDQGER